VRGVNLPILDSVSVHLVLGLAVWWWHITAAWRCRTLLHTASRTVLRSARQLCCCALCSWIRTVCIHCSSVT